MLKEDGQPVASMINKTFATAINCMDGRVQLPVIEFIKKNYHVDYVDMITHSGPDKLLAEGDDQIAVDSIQKRVNISLTRHSSRLIAAVGHHDCAGNPADKATHWKQILRAIKIIESWNYEAKVIGLWIDENWEVVLLP